MLHSINWPNFIVWLSLLLDTALQLFVVQSVTSQILKLTTAFLSSRFSTQPKSQHKNVNISRTKRVFIMKERTFFIIFKELSLIH